MATLVFRNMGSISPGVLFRSRVCLVNEFSYLTHRSRSLRNFHNKTYKVSFGKKYKNSKIITAGLFGGVLSYFSWNVAVPVLKDSGGELGKLTVSEDKIVPTVKVSRSVSGPSDIGFKVTLFQYQSCPFCCKVRAFLDFYGIPYNVVEVNPVLRQQIKFSSYRKVPIIVLEDKKCKRKQLNDSSAIISILRSYLLNQKQKLDDVLSKYPHVTYLNESKKEVVEIMNRYHLMFGEQNLKDEDFDKISEECNWREWADQELVHMLSPNIYRTWAEAVDSFKYFSEVGQWEANFPLWERYLVITVGSAAMYFIGKRLKTRHKLKDDVRQSLYDSCNTWMKGIGEKRKFMGGDQPNLADLAVYGILNSIEGCQAFHDLLKNTKIGSWYYSTQEAVKKHAGSKQLLPDLKFK